MMARLPQLAVFSFAALHLLLFSICPVSSSRIYRTSDAVVIEVSDMVASDLAEQIPSARFARSNFGYPGPIPANPYTGLYYLPYPNLPFWPYPLYNKPTISSVSADVKDFAATSPDSRQQKIACGVGPASPPQRTTPTVSIVGGSQAIPNSWPFVGLRIAGMSTAFCGGSIISTTRILTAAHCVDKLSEFEISTMTVSLGMHTQGNGNDLKNDAQQTRRITRVVYHKDFNTKTAVNDVAVLTMDPPINYSAAISPVCLPPASTAADQFVDKNAAIIGWGILNFPGGNQPNELQQATVQITSNAKCSEFYGSLLPNPLRIFIQHICAGAAGKDVCQGDSGGPLVVRTVTGATSTWTQVGVTSFGLSCIANPIAPSVYASVAFFRKWIDTYMTS
ncbi:chymotrypsinogen A-like isoform X3 [Daphnia pulicaria]|uniref:chymotrypsinogen A-like isoform X3 n=1 Tax=Daphnia pulicaria TaxID=35523 RepID=UPI001EEC98F5|nr:chymotrypsinogen A-like isoform X3 [Daphnia pulicaria]